MTCIIGLKYNNKVYLAGDSCITYGWKTVVGEPKVKRIHNFLLAGSGDASVNQIWQTMDFPIIENNPKEILIKEIIPQIREKLKGYDLLEKGLSENALFFAHKQNLFHISTSFHVREVDLFSAIGSGSEFAVGAMEVLLDSETIKPKKILTKALDISTKYSFGVKPPYTILETE